MVWCHVVWRYVVVQTPATKHPGQAPEGVSEFHVDRCFELLAVDENFSRGRVASCDRKRKNGEELQRGKESS